MAKVWVANVPKGEVKMFKMNYSRSLTQGAPQRSSVYTSAQLESMGYVGLYEDDPDEEEQA